LVKVFPTPVGVFLWGAAVGYGFFCLPHARGGVSAIICEYSAPVESSPRPWGCFSVGIALCVFKVVFPTPVGVFPLRK